MIDWGGMKKASLNSTTGGGLLANEARDYYIYQPHSCSSPGNLLAEPQESITDTVV